MRDKVLCRGEWSGESTSQRENEFWLHKKSCSVIPTDHSIFLSSACSVSVLVREGEKMSIDEVFGFFDRSAVWNDQKTQREFSEQTSRQSLDTISVAESLFRGIAADFGDLGFNSGGGNYANCFAVSWK